MAAETGVRTRNPEQSDESPVPEALGWRRRPDLDEGGREAWRLPDGMLLLLDPSERSDSLLRRAPDEEPGGPADRIRAARSYADRVAQILRANWQRAPCPAG